MFSTTLAICGFLVAMGLGSWAKQQIIKEGQTLVFALADALGGEIKELARTLQIMADSSWITAALATESPRDIQRADLILEKYNKILNTSGCFLLDKSGVAVAVSNRSETGNSLKGDSHAHQPYFQNVLRGTAGGFFSGGANAEHSLFISVPVRDYEDRIAGVAVIKKDMDMRLGTISAYFIENAHCFLVNSEGVILLSSHPREFGQGALPAFTSPEPRNKSYSRLNGRTFLVNRLSFGADGWSFILFSPTTKIQVYRLAGLFGLFLFVVLIAGLYTSARLGQRSHEESRTRKVLEETTAALATIAERKDPYTAGHQRRVAQLATSIAKEMKLERELVRGLYIASIIHDVGKICVPAEILSKPGKLTDIEFSIIKTHPQIGYEILSPVRFPWPVAQIVLQHHERLNGSGYPQGIKGDRIMLEAKILNVADVIESMAFHRPYRPALGIDAALHEISEKRSLFYDPQVVDACLSVFTKRKFSFK